MTVTIDRGAALKEWAAVVKALESGTQVLILRKGGIREEGFSAEAAAFFFYPTGFHQTTDKLRSEHIHFMEEAMADRPPEGRVRIRSMAQTAGVFAVPDEDKLASLAGEYVYTVDEMKKRHEFRPGDSLTALAVRVYILKQPAEILLKTNYGGCVSWVHLEDPVSTEGAKPVLSDDAFDQRLRRIRDILSPRSHPSMDSAGVPPSNRS